MLVKSSDLTKPQSGFKNLIAKMGLFSGLRNKNLICALTKLKNNQLVRFEKIIIT